MRRAAALVLALGVAAGCDALPGRPDPADRYVRPDRITDFEQLYGRSCAGCHGREGSRGPARPLRDPLYLKLAGADVLRRSIAEGVSGTAMSPFLESEGGSLSEAQVDALAQGLLASWGDDAALAGVALPPYSASDSLAAGHAAGDARRGAQAYRAFCAECHGDDGRGGKHGGSIVDGSYLGLVSDQALRSAVIAGRTDLGMPDYRGEQARHPMTPQQISDVVAWLVVQRPAFPGQPYAEGQEDE